MEGSIEENAEDQVEVAEKNTYGGDKVEEVKFYYVFYHFVESRQVFF